MKRTTFTRIINAIDKNINESHGVIVSFDNFVSAFATSFELDEWDIVTMYKGSCMTCMAPVSSIRTIRVVRYDD